MVEEKKKKGKRKYVTPCIFNTKGMFHDGANPIAKGVRLKGRLGAYLISRNSWFWLDLELI